MRTATGFVSYKRGISPSTSSLAPFGHAQPAHGAGSSLPCPLRRGGAGEEDIALPVVGAPRCFPEPRNNGWQPRMQLPCQSGSVALRPIHSRSLLRLLCWLAYCALHRERLAVCARGRLARRHIWREIGASGRTGLTKEITVFGKHRLAATSFAPLTASTEAAALAARRRALVSLHSLGASGAARSKVLRASLLAHPLCWSNRVQPPRPALAIARETPIAEAAPQAAPPRAPVPHHAQRPMLVPVGSWNSYLPWGTPGLSRTHGPLLLRERP